MLDHVLSHLDWILSLSAGDIAAVLAALVATVWGAVRMSVNAVRGVLAAAVKVMAWYRTPSQITVLKGEVASTRAQLDRLCAVWEIPTAEPEEGRTRGSWLPPKVG